MCRAGWDPAPDCALRVSGQPSVPEADDSKDTARVTALVQTFVPGALLRDSRGCELRYAVPGDADRAGFAELFQALEQNRQRLRLTGYGVSVSTLEEVLEASGRCLSPRWPPWVWHVGGVGVTWVWAGWA